MTEQVAFETPPRLDPTLHLDPLTLYRRLLDGDPPVLVDLRSVGAPPRLIGSVQRPASADAERVESWLDDLPGDSQADRDVLLVDADGRTASNLARVARAAGHGHVWALYGGIALYDFVLDPQVVPGDRFLR